MKTVLLCLRCADIKILHCQLHFPSLTQVFLDSFPWNCFQILCHHSFLLDSHMAYSAIWHIHRASGCFDWRLVLPHWISDISDSPWKHWLRKYVAYYHPIFPAVTKEVWVLTENLRKSASLNKFSLLLEEPVIIRF